MKKAPKSPRAPARESSPSARAAAAEPGTPSARASSPKAPSDTVPDVGGNLRRLRTERGLSLESLSRASGVSRAMLGQIELGRSAPTITVMWKIASALGVPFSALLSSNVPRRLQVMPAANAPLLESADGGFTSRALFPADGARHVEFYELTVAPGTTEHAEPHPPGTTENLVVTAGRLTLSLAGQSCELGRGDAAYFLADVEHSYINRGASPVCCYLVMTYVRT